MCTNVHLKMVVPGDHLSMLLPDFHSLFYNIQRTDHLLAECPGMNVRVDDMV